MHEICLACGEYEIDVAAWDQLTYLDSRERDDLDRLSYLAAHLRQATDVGELVVVTRENWRELADGHRSTPVQIKAQKLLTYIARHTDVGRRFYVTNERLLAAART